MVASPHTELWDLLQDGVMSAAVIALMLLVVRGWTAILICVIESFLIFVAVLYGCGFQNRQTLFVAINYTAIHDAAFYAELAIISARTLFGLREIGADVSRLVAGNTAPSVGGGRSERHP
jgi:hypothetical protein